MTRTREELNPEILRDRLPDNYREVLDQAESNARRAAGVLVGGYKKRLESLARQLEEGTFSEELKTKISDLQESFQRGLRQIAKSANGIKEEAEQLKDNAQSSSDLKKLAESLSTEATNLQQLLDAARTKVQDFGEVSGRVLGTALRGLI